MHRDITHMLGDQRSVAFDGHSISLVWWITPHTLLAIVFQSYSLLLGWVEMFFFKHLEPFVDVEVEDFEAKRAIITWSLAHAESPVRFTSRLELWKNDWPMAPTFLLRLIVLG